MRAAQRLGKQLRRLRTDRGLTQEQLAVNVGLSHTFITRLELGQHDSTLSPWWRWARALGVGVPFLLGKGRGESLGGGWGKQRFATQKKAEDQARHLGDMFIARYQNKPAGPVRRLFPVR